MRSLIALAAVAAIVSPAGAQDGFLRCDTIAKQMLAAQSAYGEVPSFMAQTKDGAVVVFTTSKKTGTWTMWVIPTDAPDRLCMFDGGANWAPASEGVKAIAPAGKPS